MKLFVCKSLFGLLAICGVAIILFNGCKKENTDITAVITVKYQIDTLRVVPFADIVIGRDYDDVKVTGKTDATGVFSTPFKLEAILDIVASIDTNTGSGPQEPIVSGESVIRLRPGEVTYKTVYIN